MNTPNIEYISQSIKIGDNLIDLNNYKGLFLTIPVCLNRIITSEQTFVINYYSQKVSNKEQYMLDTTDPNCIEKIINTVNYYISLDDFFSAFNYYIVNLSILTDLNCRTVVIQYFNDYVFNNHTVNATVQKYILEHLADLFLRP